MMIRTDDRNVKVIWSPRRVKLMDSKVRPTTTKSLKTYFEGLSDTDIRSQLCMIALVVPTLLQQRALSSYLIQHDLWWFCKSRGSECDSTPGSEEQCEYVDALMKTWTKVVSAISNGIPRATVLMHLMETCDIPARVLRPHCLSPLEPT